MATNTSGQNYGIEMIDFANIYKLVTTRITIKPISSQLLKPAILFDLALKALLSSFSVCRPAPE